MRYAILLCAVCLVACGSCGSRSASRQHRANPQPPVRYGYKIVAEYPHDTDAYTQGLFWHEGALYESTGEYGRSDLRRVELETGTTTREISLDDDFFGEGAALLGGRIYQLTWQKGCCFVWDANTFEPIGEFTYRGQGWGLTTDGEKLYMSDGTPNITVRNGTSFAAEHTIVVRNQGRPVQDINELEWIDGCIWANIYLTNEIIVIDPSNGRVEGVIDFTGIASHLVVTPSTDVMNGIAYDPATKRIFVTGKNWNKLFEIELVKK